MSTWQTVFEAHPGAKSIWVGTNKDNEKQPFLERTHALSFAHGKDENVEQVFREKAPAPELKKA